MPVKVKPINEVVQKWGDVTPGRQMYYESGALAAGDDWQRNTVAASMNYKSAVSAGNIEALFKGGVQRAGAEKYTRKIKDVGASRFSTGVQAAKTDYQTGIEPYLQTIAPLTLTARQPRGSASNLLRVTEVATALHKRRLAMKAAGG